MTDPLTFRYPVIEHRNVVNSEVKQAAIDCSSDRIKSYALVLATLSQFTEDKNAVAKGLFKYFNSHKRMIRPSFANEVTDGRTATTDGRTDRRTDGRTDAGYTIIRPVIDGRIKTASQRLISAAMEVKVYDTYNDRQTHTMTDRQTDKPKTIKPKSIDPGA
ncbi:hypothetical protein DPMN_109330 [Dreissena polymorpha]|uniref:Uncharacterized protein n=1 Tax=Dreissena polymorpha TaxID=45954 RepID=A0A9D4KAX8_DREPO|nr:hypothetical protein DPMN_109330 [Dreissena polymorpha]